MNSNFGHRVRRLRQDRGWSQQELSLRCKISTPHLSSIERGKRFPSLDYAQRLAVALGVSLQALCDDVSEMKTPQIKKSTEELPMYLQNFVLNEAAQPYLQAAQRLSTLPQTQGEVILQMINLLFQSSMFPFPTKA